MKSVSFAEKTSVTEYESDPSTDGSGYNTNIDLTVQTLLRDAVLHHNIHQVREILQSSIHCIDFQALAYSNGLTLLHEAVHLSIRQRFSGKISMDNVFTIADLLLTAGADINVLDRKGRSPIQIANEDDNVEMLEFLINKGADASRLEYEDLWIIGCSICPTDSTPRPRNDAAYNETQENNYNDERLVVVGKGYDCCTIC